MSDPSWGERWMPRGGPPLAVTFARHDRDFAPHRHWFHELVLVAGGRGVHTIGEHRHTVRRGDVFLVATSEVHGYAGVKGLELVNVLIDPARLRLPTEDLRGLASYHQLFTLEPARRERGALAPGLRLPPAALAGAVELAGDLERHLRAGGPGSTCAAEGCLLLLVAQICRESASVGAERDVARLAEALAHIERCCDRPLAVGELAARSGCGIRQFQRLFREATGHSASEYHLRLRIERAQRLLRADPERPIATIASAVGFDDANHFARQFRRCVGTSARAWRAAHAADLEPGPHRAAW